MATEKVSATYRYTLRTHYKHFTKQIKPHDSILKHKDFLIESFSSMFMSSINFDAEFLFKKLQVAYTINTVSTEYRSMNISGLKITYSFDKDQYINNFNNKIVNSNILTIYQHSSELTDPDFDDLISKLTRYCKELTPVNDTKIIIARRMTATKIEPETYATKIVGKKKKDKKNTKK